MEKSTKKGGSKNRTPADLHSLFRNQIVQNYPNNSHYNGPVFMDEEQEGEKQPDFMDFFMRDNDIVEEYVPSE